MEPECANSTLIAVVTGAAIPIVGWIVFHFFASSRDKKARMAAASADFRDRVLQYTKGVPDANKHWPNHVLSTLKNEKSELDTACQIFQYFLTCKKREGFEAAAREFSELISKDLPGPKSEQELASSGGVPMSEDKKNKFYELRKRLLSYANST